MFVDSLFKFQLLIFVMLNLPKSNAGGVDIGHAVNICRMNAAHREVNCSLEKVKGQSFIS